MKFSSRMVFFARIIISEAFLVTLEYSGRDEDFELCIVFLALNRYVSKY